MQLVHEETCRNVERLQNENERMSKKLEIVTTDYGDLQRNSSKTETELQATVRDLQTRLNTYEKIEKVRYSILRNSKINAVLYGV